ncbi:MAG: RNA methyltransferase [Bdellovibrionaceae bacterium]|nr:RNA methyltransferase [Pseudobdellovibrionaceae bacterium]
MAVFFASTAKGLVDELYKELETMGLRGLKRVPSGVEFESSWEGCYAVNLRSRLASRILKPVAEFIAYEPEELYGHIMKHDFTRFIKPTQTFAVDAIVSEGKMRDQRYVALKVKDAIADQFRDKFDVRPDVDKYDPDLRVWVRAYKNKFHVAIDTSGAPLHERGYRKEAGEAPMKENLAAGLLALSEWDGQQPIVDPMCGSGTLLIEAALMASRIAPGSFRKNFAFQRFQNYDKEMWERVIDEAMDEEIEEPEIKFYGFDMDKKVLLKAKENARRAGVDHLIEFNRGDVTTLQAPVPEGMIITNPPYAVRLGDEDNVRDVYRDFSHTLKTQFKGWNAWVLSGNADLIKDLRLKSTRKHFVFNGPIECRLLKYEIR